MSRRGPPKEIWSDRGTNFVGANRELREAIARWSEEEIDRQLQQKGIKWVFQPPAAPHASRVWERLVQIMKKYLKSAVADRLLSDIELRTLLAEVESIVNNRPMTAVSDDPEDCSALTPNHFLLQKATQLPPGSFTLFCCRIGWWAFKVRSFLGSPPSTCISSLGGQSKLQRINPV